ncbi:hypothetical protein GN244_ATG03064 [Phytophthora infestans]|uniref:Uncharacterized protein n=1 Tax=Phytophthora infestans TaxID=4787 RepID=A0A833WLC6_PHYIN|nr:hypothetical protein GN244_ATG03064 [Phytophthora infestans]
MSAGCMHCTLGASVRKIRATRSLSRIPRNNVSSTLDAGQVIQSTTPSIRSMPPKKRDKEINLSGKMNIPEAITMPVVAATPKIPERLIKVSRQRVGTP